MLTGMSGPKMVMFGIDSMVFEVEDSKNDDIIALQLRNSKMTANKLGLMPLDSGKIFRDANLSVNQATNKAKIPIYFTSIHVAFIALR